MIEDLAVYKALSRWLADLWARGLGESDEAHAVGDAAERPWDAMTEAERDEARAYSADVEDEPYPEGETPASAAAELGVPADAWAAVEREVREVPPRR